MNSLHTLPEVGPGVAPVAERRISIGLAVVFLAGFVAMMATSTDREPDADPAKIIASYETTLGAVRIESYVLMALCAVLVFLGTSIRSRLSAVGHRWAADAALVGFGLMAFTYASFGVTTLALRHAVDLGDTSVVSAANLADTSNFLPAMAAMACIYIGVGVSALGSGALPRWLSWASIVLGVLAPLGPGGFAPFVLLPGWLLLVAVLLPGDADVKGR